MVPGLKNTLAYITAIGVVGLSGCDYKLSVSERDKVTEKALTSWVDTTDSYMEIDRLLKKGEYKRAKILVSAYLQNERKKGQLTKEVFEAGSLNIFPSLREESIETIDKQLKKIDSSLR